MQLKQPFAMWSLLISALGTCVLTAPNLAWADEAALQRQIEAQQRTIYAHQGQIAQMQQDIATLRGELEQIRYLMSRQQGGSYQNTAPINPNPAPINPNPAPVAGNNAVHDPAPSPSTSLPGVDAVAQQAYNAAYDKVKRNDLKGAQAAFQDYVNKYPNNTLTPNAWYWLGQVQYSQALYEQARLSFLNVARYNDSQKRPDALYKLGMISKFLGDTSKATRYFQLVVQSYPTNAAAALANRELQRLQ